MTDRNLEIRIERVALRLRGVAPAAANDLSRDLSRALSEGINRLDFSAASGGQVAAVDAGTIKPRRPDDGGALSRAVGDAVAGALGGHLAGSGKGDTS